MPGCFADHLVKTLLLGSLILLSACSSPPIDRRQNEVYQWWKQQSKRRVVSTFEAEGRTYSVIEATLPAGSRWSSGHVLTKKDRVLFGIGDEQGLEILPCLYRDVYPLQGWGLLLDRAKHWRTGGIPFLSKAHKQHIAFSELAKIKPKAVTKEVLVPEGQKLLSNTPAGVKDVPKNSKSFRLLAQNAKYGGKKACVMTKDPSNGRFTIMAFDSKGEVIEKTWFDSVDEVNGNGFDVWVGTDKDNRELISLTGWGRVLGHYLGKDKVTVRISKTKMRAFDVVPAPIGHGFVLLRYRMGLKFHAPRKSVGIMPIGSVGASPQRYNRGVILRDHWFQPVCGWILAFKDKDGRLTYSETDADFKETSKVRYKDFKLIPSEQLNRLCRRRDMSVYYRAYKRQDNKWILICGAKHLDIKCQPSTSLSWLTKFMDAQVNLAAATEETGRKQLNKIYAEEYRRQRAADEQGFASAMRTGDAATARRLGRKLGSSTMTRFMASRMATYNDVLWVVRHPYSVHSKMLKSCRDLVARQQKALARAQAERARRQREAQQRAQARAAWERHQADNRAFMQSQDRKRALARKNELNTLRKQGYTIYKKPR